MNNKKDLKRLLNRVYRGEATDEDIRAYNRWCQSFQQENKKDPSQEDLSSEMWETIERQTVASHKTPGRKMLWPKIAVAASLALLIGTGAYYFIHSTAQKGAVVVKAIRHIQPGGNKATLTLGNGKTIALNKVAIGALANQGGSHIIKTGNGILAYQNDKPGTSGPDHGINGSQASKSALSIEFNTLKIPRGGQFQLELSDGTKVWLNSASSIRFPVSFEGGKRRVSVTGEVYMEVAEDAQHPFIVHTRHSDITVLGTRFNIKAYDDEPAVTTTLIQGAVKISLPGRKEAKVLSPGQQAKVDNQSDRIKIQKVDASDVAAWTDGLLSLKGCSIQEFMNQLSRWYDVDIEYEGKLPQKRFGGVINRNAPLSDVLAALAAGGIHTRVEGGKIIVLSH